MRLHFLLPFAKQKKSARRNGAEPQKTLDGDSRKCDSLSCDTTEKGCRNFVSVAFFFCGSWFFISTERGSEWMEISTSVGFLSFIRFKKLDIQTIQLVRDILAERWHQFLVEN